MKDAKGHGSDPRGAHSTGINNLGNYPPGTKIIPFRQVKPQDSVPADSERVVNFRGMIRRGEPLQPLVVTSDHYLIDGNHRYAAYKAERVKSVPVRVSEGGLEPW